MAGKEPVNGWLCLVLYLFISIGFSAYLQSSLNKVWEAEAEPLPGHDAPPPVSDRDAAAAGFGT